MHQFLKFKPILKEKIWGGEKLVTLLNKKSNKKNIGESWEICGLENNISVVAKGSLKGKNLKELINTYTTDLVGEKVYKKFGDEFPLLIKFIDARDKLSIQLHPDDILAKERHNAFGKTEMWYIMQADEDSSIIVGFKEDSNEAEYIKHLENKTLLDILNVDKVTKGDVYFIPTGRIHAIGAGVVLAEIQQTSDITYRVYDWDRKDCNDQYRDLHTDMAIDAIDYSAQASYKSGYTLKENTANKLISCNYFTTNIISIDKRITVNHEAKDSFVVYMCVEGKATFSYKDCSRTINIGQTLLVPASIKEHCIDAIQAKLLEVYIP